MVFDNIDITSSLRRRVFRALQFMLESFVESVSVKDGVVNTCIL